MCCTPVSGREVVAYFGVVEVVKIPRSVLSSKMSEWNDYVQIVENETSVEVGES